MATNIVTIETPDSIVSCSAEGATQQVLNVKNTCGRSMRVGMKVVVDAPAQEDWLQIEGPSEQELDDKALNQVKVKIQVPPDCPPGRYSYRLLVFSTRNPGEEFTQGEPVAFEVPERKVEPKPEPKPGCSWCIPAAIIAGVLLIGGLLTWILWPAAEPEPEPQPVAEVTVPKLKGKSLDVALPIIIKEGFVFKAENLKQIVANDSVGKVVDQKPADGTKAPKGSEIMLMVGKSQSGIVFTQAMIKQIQITQPSVLKELIRLNPRSVEPADE